MSNKTNEQNNRLIVIFMEFTINDCDIVYLPDHDIVNEFNEKIGTISNNKHISELEYHCDWNWLISVIDKIKSLNLEHPSMTDKIDFYLLGCHIKNTYDAVIDFIKEFNK